MADYIKREDALQAVIDCWEPWFGSYPAGDIVRCPYFAINKIPSADVVEVVRCKDCSHAHKTSFPSELRICLTTGCFHSENHFCSDGKRMDGE